MNESRIRAPFAMLRELLGEPDPHHGIDKTSTCFRHAFEGRTVYVHDFHKDEWGSSPACRTDPHYVWSVYGADVDAFCRWVSARVIQRMRESKSLDHADRDRLNALLAEGVSLSDALKRVRMTGADDQAALYVAAAG